MALRDTPKPATAGTFEEPEGAVATPAQVAPANAPAAANEPQAAATAAAPAPTAAPASAATAVAARPAGSVVVALPTDTIWKALQNAIPIDEIANLGIGTFPRITATPGGFQMDKSKSIGKKLKIEVVSWNWVWLITTGEQNNAEANKLIRTSYDGVNLKDGEGLVTDYHKWLKTTEGYEKAEVKKYAEIYGNLLSYQTEDSDGNRKTVDVAIEDQKFVQVSLSPQSLAQFQAHMLGSKMRLAKGVQDSNILTLIGEAKTLGPNTFGLITFSSK